MTEASQLPISMSGVQIRLQRIHRALEGCFKTLPPAGEGDDRGWLIQQQCQTAMRGMGANMGGDMTYEEVVHALRFAGLALDKLVALARPEEAGSHEDARMGALRLRERLVDSGVLSDLMTASAEVWSITSAKGLQDLSEVRPRAAIAHGACAPGRLPYACPEASLDPKQPLTPYAMLP
jgi:hypothetical protein